MARFQLRVHQVTVKSIQASVRFLCQQDAVTLAFVAHTQHRSPECFPHANIGPPLFMEDSIVSVGDLTSKKPWLTPHLYYGTSSLHVIHFHAAFDECPKCTSIIALLGLILI